MTLRPWREVAIPRDDVCKGVFQQAEFAADISAVRKGNAPTDYQNPENFFSMTYITAGMRDLIKAVLMRITGTGGDPVVQLKTAFGGGKTHSLLAVYHIARQEVPLSNLNGINPILKELNIYEVPKAKVVVIDGTNQNPSAPRTYGNFKANTLWGDIAYQLGGIDAFEKVKSNDEDGTAPTKDLFISLLKEYGPVAILMDELVRYISQFKEGKEYVGGTYNSNLSFIQSLTEAVKQVPNAILLASLPDSNREAGDTHGLNTLKTLEHYFGRVQAIWRPVETQESFEIVRRRLFSPISNESVKEEVCNEFVKYYLDNPDSFPAETQESIYKQKLLSAYPIHPEVFERLYTDWSSLPNFQRTRGVLRLMAKIIYKLWTDGNTDALIMPGNLPLNSDVKTELTTYLTQGWDPVIDGDVDGENSQAVKIEKKQVKLGTALACRKVARTIFFGTAPGSQNKLKQGLDRKQILLGSADPNFNPSTFSDALDQIASSFHYLNIGNDDYWFDIRQNLIKEMEDRKKRMNKTDLIEKEIKKHLQTIFKPADPINSVHIFTPSDDIPDDKQLKLVILPISENYNRSQPGFGTAETVARQILQNKGGQIRKYQNRLLFLAADGNVLERLIEQVVSFLAWESITDDYDNNRLTLDNIQAASARKSKDNVLKYVKQTVKECFNHLLIPGQQVIKGIPENSIEIEEKKLNPGSPDLMRNISSILKEEEFLISEWSQTFLRDELKKWYWNKQDYLSAESYYDDTCRYLYFPRLTNDGVLQNAIAKGTDSEDFFGLAYGFNDGKYDGFKFGEKDPFISIKSLLLIEPSKAKAYKESLKPAVEPVQPIQPQEDKGKSVNPTITTDPEQHPPEKDTEKKPHVFFGTINLNPNMAANQMMDINEEVIRLLTNACADVEISVDITARLKTGFNKDTQRSVSENCRALSFKDAQFEERNEE